MNRELSRMRELSGAPKSIAAVATVVIILLAVWSLLSQMGLFNRPDSVSGYFALQVNPDPNTPPSQQLENSVFGFERLALSGDGTFRMGFLRGNWRRSGSAVSLEPTSAPKSDQFYSKTSMAPALSIMLKPSEFKISADERTLTAVNSANGPVVFTKTNGIFR